MNDESDEASPTIRVRMNDDLEETSPTTDFVQIASKGLEAVNITVEEEREEEVLLTVRFRMND